MEADIDDFKAGYQRHCKEQGVDIQDFVLKQIDAAKKSPRQGGGYLLNLSTLSVTAKTCGVLAKLLTSDKSFVEIKFNDCSLTDEAVKALCYGLVENSTCRRLDLKGNSITGSGAEALAKVLRQNTKLASLCLEWNELGSTESTFTSLCEGLAVNHSLLSLDLRSNHISHHGAEQLSSALKRNDTLRILDLRFNSIGLLGGRAVLSCLDYNKTLVKIMLAGNNIPGDILKSIEAAVSRNAGTSLLNSDMKTKQKMMSSHLQQLGKTHHKEVSQLLDKVDRQEAAIYQTKLAAAEKVNKLQISLEDRKQQFNNAVSKLSLVESELSVAESRSKELEQLLMRSKEELSADKSQYQQEIRRLKEEKSLIEKRLNKELQDLNDKKYQLETKCEELERRVRQQQDQVFGLREAQTQLQAESKMRQVQHDEALHVERQKGKEMCRQAENNKDKETQLQAESKMRQVQHDEALHMESQKGKEICRQAENNKDKEIEKLKKEKDDLERLLSERLQKAESQRLALEEELSRIKTSRAAEREQHGEQISLAKQQTRQEEEQKRTSLEDKLKVLQTSRDEMTSHMTHQVNLVQELQSKNTQLSIDNESLKKRITDLMQELTGKNEEMREEVARVRLDFTSRIDRLESERRPKQELYDRITALEKELNDLKAAHRDETKKKEFELEKLSDRLKMREQEISKMREMDMQRSTMLTNAVHNYINKSPYNE